MLARHLNGFLAIGCRGHHLDILVLFQNHGQRAPHKSGVVNYKHSDHALLLAINQTKKKTGSGIFGETIHIPARHTLETETLLSIRGKSGKCDTKFIRKRNGKQIPLPGFSPLPVCATLFSICHGNGKGTTILSLTPAFTFQKKMYYHTDLAGRARRSPQARPARRPIRPDPRETPPFQEKSPPRIFPCKKLRLGVLNRLHTGMWLSLARALRSGRRGRRFKSSHPDHTYGESL